METPVYLFLGFLESGKTKFIQETLEDPRFSTGEKTLLLVMEEGVEEYDESKFAVKNVSIAYIEDKSELTEEKLTALQLEYGATRVVVEYNGMWLLEDFFKAMPEGWMINQLMTFFDTNTALNYNANMRQLVFDKIENTQMVVFNRYSAKVDKMDLHKLVRGITRRADIVYEYEKTPFYPAHTLLLEATLADGSNQRRMEMEPVSRHLGQHLIRTKNPHSYCVFATTDLNINVISDFRGRKFMPYYDPKDLSQYVMGMKILPLQTAELKNIIRNQLTYQSLYPVFESAYQSFLPPHDWYPECIFGRS